MRNHHPDAHFLIVGSGAELQELRDQAERRKLTNVTFVGRVAHADVIEYWRLSDIALVLLKNTPLFRTVIPSKIFEAMATGTPIITNVHGEVQTILEPLGAAEIVPPDDLPALVQAIEMLLMDSDRRRQRSAAAVAGARKYDRAALADDVLVSLETLVADSRMH
jgi:glycosyltransferase involved in cell wall biosynthesis